MEMNKSDSEILQMVSDFLEHGDDCYAEAQYYSESKQCQADLRRIADTIERKTLDVVYNENADSFKELSKSFVPRERKAVSDEEINNAAREETYLQHPAFGEMFRRGAEWVRDKMTINEKQD